MTVTAAGAGALTAGANVRANETLADSDRLDKSSKKESFKEFVTRKLGELDAVTGPDGDIQRELNALRERFEEVSAKLDKCDQTIGDHNDVAAVRKTLCEIGKALNIPCP